MSLAIAIWILFLLWTVLYGYWSFNSPPAPAGQPGWLGYGGGIVFWLLMLVVCWAVAGSPIKG